jgi:peptide/nickel transport system ATP-binding protein
VLNARGLTLEYGFGRNRLVAVDDVSFSIPHGGTLGLVGESGSGKSTIARALVGLLPIKSGAVVFDGVEHTSDKTLKKRGYRRRVQIVFQDPNTSLNPRMTIGETLDEALARRGDIPRAARRNEAIRTLELVGISRSTLARYPHQFSGGQLQRIAIARVLAVRPEVIVMDEVTSALDVSVQAAILNLLRDLQRELRLSLLFISHDLSVVGYMSDVVAVLHLGQLIEMAPAATLFSDPAHPYTLALINSVPRFERNVRTKPLAGDLPDPHNPPSGCRFHTRCPVGPLVRPERTICIESDPAQDAALRRHFAACHFAARSAPHSFEQLYSHTNVRSSQ